MKRRHSHLAGVAIAAGAAASMLLGGTARATVMYWDGTGSAWGTAGDWSTSAVATTPDPSRRPRHIGRRDL